MSSLIAIWLMGFVGSAHCFAMCGSIAGSLGLASPKAKNKTNDKESISVMTQPSLDGAHSRASSQLETDFAHKNKLFILSMFNLGRLLSYMFAGFLVGWLGFFSKDYLLNPAEINIPRLISAFFIMLVGFYVLDFKSSLAWIEKLGSRIWRFIQPLSRSVLPVRSSKQALGLGLVWGWLPCGMVYSALILSATAASPQLAVWHMLAFGLGTLPSMMTVGYLTQQLSRWKKLYFVRLIIFLTMISCSLWTAYLAIPQLQTHAQAEHQHHH